MNANEIVLKFTLDIKGIKSAINQVEKDLKKFGSESQGATQGLNQALDQTEQQLDSISSKSKNLANNASQSFDKFRVSAGAASGSAIAFNRIIQDAPFGIIGVANNIQQFAEQLSALRSTSTSTGAAVRTFFSSLLTPANLAILAVSAVTSALTLYALNAEKTKSPVEELTKAQEDFNKSLKNTNALLAQDLLNKLLKDLGLLKTENLGGRLVDVPAFKSAGEVVDALSGKINNLRKGELELLEQYLQGQIGQNLRSAANSSEEFVKKLAQDEINLYRGLLEKVNQQLEFYNITSDDASKSTKKLNDEVTKLKRTFEELINLPNAGLPREGDIDALRARFKRIQEGGRTGQTGQEFIDAEINKVKEAGIITTQPVSGLAENFQQESDQIKLQVEELAQAFTGLGSVIGRAFNNPQLGTFLGEFLRFASKLVAANFKIAGSNAVAGASQASVATGAAAPITLPAFIAGALGVVAAAFAAFGNFGSSGGSVSAGVGSTFTNREFGGPVSKGRAYIVGERRPELFVPNTNGIIVPQLPSMDYSGASMSASNYGVDIRLKGPDDLLFFVEQAQIRRGLR